MTEVHYTAKEERLNVISHASGILLSIAALILLLWKSDNKLEYVSSIIFGSSLIILYTASTLYHAAKDKSVRARLRIFDHTSIYLLIAGTYTPICLVTLNPGIGITLLIVVWSAAVVGIVLKLFFTGKYDRLSTIMYVVMGWAAIFAIKPIMNTMETKALLWLLFGGIFYTLGALIYSIRKLSMNHAIFHFFVLGGSLCHFFTIYCYVL